LTVKNEEEMHMAASVRDDLHAEITSLEESIVESRKKLADLRHRLPRENVNDYTFLGPDGGATKLSQLFGPRDELLLIHNMGKGCSYCTLWADGFNGFLRHLENRAAFVVISPDDPETQRVFAASRGWNFKMLSSKGTTFFKDMGFEKATGKPMPGVSTFQRDSEGLIYRVSKADFGPGDDYCAVWHLFELLPRGVNDWGPKFSY
jgi:predicted dithiol-disulfide oxidoreductase (DUF899 family)